ncbi:HET-domain-containing protein [Hypoxylon trugodes]|uniref:HET-domain-containing protein n=1 Tax=Hypoxylon trugodes TaxID=326681 RepID=UPI00219C2551|nr:HET-domain-containing protein [Hypoxylon trugodes]KAI1385841.1 HET-domain-containing protein [Hypoxylon trugodes]
MASSYKYEPLPKNSIRFIELDPDLKDGKPQLKVLSCARDEAPEYISMSYCWGQDPESESIFLDDLPFAVRPNLFQLLLHLRYHRREYTEWRYFWIDAICIDQSNTAEKTEQVSRMETTYRNASTIAAWLGVPPAERNQERTGRDHISELSSPSLVDEIFTSVYWSRMWIVQELILAKNIVLLYGHLRLPWKGMSGVLQAWSTFGKSRWRHSATINLVNMTVGAAYTQEHGRALGELMRYLEHSEATDPRDRVFALLGLVEGEEREVLGTIFPDYEMSHEKVMLVTMAYLKQIYAPRPFKWVVKPQQVWSEKVFGLDKETWEKMWSETEGYETPHDLTNYSSVWNAKGIGKLLKPGQAGETFRGQKEELKRQRRKWFELRVDALRKLASESSR